MFRRELFRGSIINRDSRLIPVYVSCQYSIASLFFGMFLVLSGVMVTTNAENEDENHINQSDANYFSNKNRTSRIVGLILLIAGCISISLAIILFFYASLMFMKTTTTPPDWNCSQELPQEVVVCSQTSNGEVDNETDLSADNENNKIQTGD